MTVPRCKNKSNPRAFCLPNNCSAPPEIAPDNPALFPDCKTMKTTIIIALIINNTLTAVAIKSLPLLHKQNIYPILYHVTKGIASIIKQRR